MKTVDAPTAVREPNEPPDAPAIHREGRLITVAQPGPPTWPLPPGTHPLGALGSPDSVLLVPPGTSPAHPLPLVLMLHGAGSAPAQVTSLLQEPDGSLACAVVLAPKSHDSTWDVIRGGYGNDVALIDRLLAWTFERAAIDAQRVAIGGFSDGASYALSLALANPQLFTHVLAFSPGYFVQPRELPARLPDIYVSHGHADRVLPREACGERVVTQLRRLGCEVVYREFDGGHDVPDTVRQEAMRWLQA